MFYVAGGVTVSSNSALKLQAHMCAGSVDTLHVVSDTWALPSGGCVRRQGEREREIEEEESVDDDLWDS